MNDAMQAFAPCTGTVSRALMRVWLTFGRSMYDAKELFQADTNTAQDDINAVYALMSQRNKKLGPHLKSMWAPAERLSRNDPNRVDRHVISGRFSEK
jgi:hypothetical protein